jgi:hypothetical protein
VILNQQKETMKLQGIRCIRFPCFRRCKQDNKEVSDKYKAFFVPTLEMFERYSTNALVGDNFIVEHVHPNIEGYSLWQNHFITLLWINKIIDEEPYEFALF